ncbi:MAG: ATP-binding protein [Deltaproteobacteria bacterium]|nr:ATP-binding protein [Deltaproteobacteria bacterium]
MGKSLLSPDLKGRLSEQVVANELFYRYDRQDWLSSNVFFWKNGSEVDFVVKREKRLLPVEVKYQKNAGPSDLKAIKRLGSKNGILISRDRLEMEDGFAIIPLELFLVSHPG